jgi:HSP20 family molecular chaperone IbpA
MNDDMQDMFRRMDAIMARLFTEMEAGFSADLPPGAVGYRIVIHGGKLPPGSGGFDETGPHDAKEPIAEVHRIGNEVKVIAELPGITDESLRLDMQKDRLIIDAGDADRHYHTSAVLPPVDSGSLQKSLKNGVLEVTFRTLTEPSGKEQG